MIEMRVPCSITAFVALTATVLSSPLEQSPLHPEVRPPTAHESTILARRLLALSSTAYLSTVFPTSQDMSGDPQYRYTPDSVASAPISLPEYIADCELHGDPTLIMLDISTSARNARHGRNVSLSLDWWSGYEKVTGHKPRTSASLPRMSLLGWIEEIAPEKADSEHVAECFFEKHKDAKWWEPGRKDAHDGWWGRLRVEHVYWVGGFGGQAHIGWLDMDDYKTINMQQVGAARLPGESK
jgi:hypothetical protein